ncbi:MAG: glycosyltransferase family 39 protein, partial [Candidatus Levybacteria bacterium]|nr:glycosyltransferase family 39 protein [Candidatus Levybacteria bacterium]
MLKIKQALPFLIVVSILILTRFLNLTWGLPYPFHPDERNMANAIQQLSCNFYDLQNCFNPHFFAYGQFPIYLGYLGVYILKFLGGDLGFPISFEEAAFSLRLISTAASLITAFFIYRTFKRIFFTEKNHLDKYLLLLLFIFSPGLIQSAHFGTTESLLAMLFTWLVYESLLFINDKISLKHFLLISSIVSGLAVATKVSSLVFVALPIVAILYSSSNIEKIGSRLTTFARTIIIYAFLTFLIGTIFSPHNF